MQDAINAYINLAEKLGKPSQLDKAIENAINISIDNKMSMAVVKKDHDHYQVWSLAKAGNDNVYVAEYVVSETEDKGVMAV